MAVATAFALNVDELSMVDVTTLRPHPQNIRRAAGDLTDLAASIRAEGVLEPLLVLPDATIVCGHRRHMAAIEAQRQFVPCFVRDLTPRQQIEAMLAENLQRSDITPLEEAQAYQQLLDLGEAAEEIAARVGMREERIRKRTLLLQLPNVARELLDTGAMTLAAAEELLKLREHPNEMAEVLDGEARHAKPDRPITHFWRVESVLQEIRVDAARAKATEEAQAQGLRVVKVPYSYDRKKGSPALLGTGHMEVPLKPKDHAKLKCHAVAISDAGKLQPACTKPSSHPEFGEKKASTSSERPSYKEQRAAQEADGQARIAIIRDHLDDKDTAAHVQRLIISGRQSYRDDQLCAVLGIAFDTDSDAIRKQKGATTAFLDWLVENDVMPLRVERACAAVALLGADESLEENYLEGQEAVHQLLWLGDHGYETPEDLQAEWDGDKHLPTFVERMAKDPRLAFATGAEAIQ